MKLRFFVLFGVVLLALSLAGACGGGGGELSLQAYFQRLGDISKRVDDRDQELTTNFPNAFSDPEQTRGYYDDFLPTADQALSDIKKLDPPDEAQAAHDEFAAALDDFVKSLKTVREGLDDVESGDDLQTFFDDRSDEISPKSDRFQLACSGLQDLAGQNKIEVDLQCDDEDQSDGGGTSLDEYFQSLDAIFEEADQQIDDLQQELDDAIAISGNVDDQLQALDDFLAASIETTENAIDGITALEAPSDAADSEARFVFAARDTVLAADELRDQLRDVTTQDELDSLVADFDATFTAITNEADAACADLQDLADGNNVDVDLNCED
ncbi:MAG: hypothetical protein Q7T33_03965 [Dehalococcoidia bacterium]|nr:hypothetical protein [Dehalococcoidia bacterium]